MSVGIEAQISSTAEFARIVEGQLADVEATVARVGEYLQDPSGIQNIAPTATVPPSYDMPDVRPARPSRPVPVIPGPPQYGNVVPRQYSADLDAGGRRTPRTFVAAGAMATTALEASLDDTAPRVDARVVAAVASYDRLGPGEDHPGFSDLGHATGELFGTDGKKTRYRADPFHLAGAWDPAG